LAGAKTLDSLFSVDPPAAAKKVREMMYNIFFVEDHALHFYFLGGPDFVVGPTAPKGERNILGVLGKVGLEIGKEVIGLRKQMRDLMVSVMGKAIHPVFGLPGGISKPIKKAEQQKFIDAAKHAVEFGEFTLKIFNDIVLKNEQYVETILSDAYTHKTYYMGLVDDNNQLNFYDGKVRIVNPDGEEFAKFSAEEYTEHLAEHVEPWSYIKFLFLKNVGWRGFEDGKDSGVYAVAPLARLNVSDGMPTPKAHAAYEQYFETLGGKPVHQTLATHWARVIEMVYAAERFLELASDDETFSPDVRTIPTETPKKGVGVIEAPRGTLFHHYETDGNGIITAANLLVATQNNAARIAMSVDKSARSLIKNGKVDDGTLNLVEMAFRAYDPCHGCATHALPGQMPLAVRIYDSAHQLVQEMKQS